MHIELTASATDDLVLGFDFYDAQQSGLRQYFLDTLYSDIQSLLILAGLHIQPFKKLAVYRTLSKRFPYGIYYTLDGQLITVLAVLDTRQHPAKARQRFRPKG